MAITTHLKRYAGRRMSRRLSRTLPWIGAVVAIATVGGAIRRKGFVGGTADTALDAIPFVGGLKAVAETIRGRDFIRDKRGTPA